MKVGRQDIKRHACFIHVMSGVDRLSHADHRQRQTIFIDIYKMDSFSPGCLLVNTAFQLGQKTTQKT